MYIYPLATPNPATAYSLLEGGGGSPKHLKLKVLSWRLQGRGFSYWS